MELLELANEQRQLSEPMTSGPEGDKLRSGAWRAEGELIGCLLLFASDMNSPEYEYRV